MGLNAIATLLKHYRNGIIVVSTLPTTSISIKQYRQYCTLTKQQKDSLSDRLE